MSDDEIRWVSVDNYNKDMKNQFVFGMAAGGGLLVMLLAVFVWVYH